jgi:hypothetical protein
MLRFKAGDRVKCVKAYEDWLTLGKEYVITRDYGSSWDTVCVDGDNGLNGGFDSEHFEMIPEPPKFRVGMRVWSSDYGWGLVISYRKGVEFPLEVSFDCGAAASYTLEGKFRLKSLRPSLFLDEIKPEDWPNPPAPKPKASELKVGQHIECTTNFGDEKYMRRQVAFIDGEQVWVRHFYHEHTAFKAIDWRLPSPE